MSSRFNKALRRISNRMRGLERRMGLRPELELKTVLAAADFKQELARQQAYAERVGTPFFLLYFSLGPSFPEAEDREEAMDVLAEAVCSRMRLSDIAGRCIEPCESVAIILRGARPQGVARVVGAVKETFGLRMSRNAVGDGCARYLTCEMVAYPCSAGASPSEVPAETPQQQAP